MTEQETIWPRKYVSMEEIKKVFPGFEEKDNRTYVEKCIDKSIEDKKKAKDRP